MTGARRQLPVHAYRIHVDSLAISKLHAPPLPPLPSPRPLYSERSSKSHEMSGLNYKATEFVPGQFKYTPPVAAIPRPPEPVARAELETAPPPAPTITLNIGGSKPAQPPPASEDVSVNPSSAASQPSAPSKPPAPSAQAAPKPKSTVASGTSTPTPQNKTFTTERAKTDADKVLHDAKVAADQETLKDLFGDSAYAIQSIFRHCLTFL